MSEERAFLVAILSQPKDATARLVYADWLQERDRATEAALHRIRAQLVTLDAPRLIEPVEITLGHYREVVAPSRLARLHPERIERDIPCAELLMPYRVDNPTAGDVIDIRACDIVGGLSIISGYHCHAIAAVSRAGCWFHEIEARADPLRKPHPHRAEILELRQAENYQLNRFRLMNPGFPDPL